MADLNPIQFKRIITTKVRPTTAQLKEGELALNLADGRIYTLTDTNIIKSLGDFKHGGLITSGYNYNSLKTPGFYYELNAASALNGPPSSSGTGYLIVYGHLDNANESNTVVSVSKTVISQMYIAANTGYVSTRVSENNGSTWTVWTRPVYNGDAIALGDTVSLKASNDANGLSIVFKNTADNIIGSIKYVESTGLSLVAGSNTAVFSKNDGSLTIPGGFFEGGNRVYSPNNIPSTSTIWATDKIIPSANANNIGVGQYYIDNTNTGFTNFPTLQQSNYIGSFLCRIIDKTGFYQEYHNYAENAIYTRSYRTSSGWSAWVRLVNMATTELTSVTKLSAASLNITGPLTVSNNIGITGNANIAGTATFNGAANFNNATTFSGNINLAGNSRGILKNDVGVTELSMLIGGICGSNDLGYVAVGATAENAGFLEIGTTDDGSEPIYVRQRRLGNFVNGPQGSTIVRTLVLLNETGDTYTPGTINSTGGFALHTSVGGVTNGLFNGNGDDANFGTYNIMLRSYNGIGVVDGSGNCNLVINARTGSLFSKGVISADTIVANNELSATGITATNLYAVNNRALNFTVSNSSGTTGNGISLYYDSLGGNGKLPSYGMAFAGSGTFGTHGFTNGDWATYFTMGGVATRGWIFKNSDGATGNVASLRADGLFSANTGYTIKDPQGAFLNPYGMYAGNGDGASFDTTNLIIRSHYGIGFQGLYGVNTIVFDTRTGDISTKGQIGATGNISTSGSIGAGSNIIATGNIFGANITATNNISAANTITAAGISATTSIVAGQDVIATASLVTKTGRIQSDDAYHYIDMGKGGVNTLRLASYGGVFDFRDSKTNNSVVYIDNTGSLATVGNLSTAASLYVADNIAAKTINATGDIKTTAWMYANNFVGPLNGNADTATKLQTTRYINNVAFDGTSDIAIPYITSIGEFPAPTDGNLYGAAGLSMGLVYNNGYPISYGNVINLTGAGWGQIVAEWSGSGTTTGRLYYRSARDATKAWSSWKTVAYLDDNVASATKLQTSRTISLIGDVTGSVSFNGTANATITAKLAASGVNAGNYGSNNTIPLLNIDTDGTILSASSTLIASASTTTRGITYLVDRIDSSSTTDAVTPNALKTVYDYVTSNGLGITSKDYQLPYFSNGVNNITDEYLVLVPYAARNNAYAMGTFRMSRGEDTSLNRSRHSLLTVNTGYGTTKFSLVDLSLDGDISWLYFSVLTIGGKDYLALKSYTGGGEDTSISIFSGSASGDSRLFTRVRASDSGVSVKVENVKNVEKVAVSSDVTNLTNNKYDKTGGTISGNVSITGDLVLPNGGATALVFLATGLIGYTPNKQGAYLSWNRNAGLGRTDFINHRGGGGGGFDFWNGTESGYGSLLTIDPNMTEVRTPLMIWGDELGNNNPITFIKNPNAAITTNNPSAGGSIRNAISFKWYQSDWQIGNVRGGSNESAGFGITNSNSKLNLLINDYKLDVFDSIVKTKALYSEKFWGTGDVSFATENDQVARRIRTGGILVSSAWSDATYIPNNGIYSKGDISTAGWIYSPRFVGNSEKAEKLTNARQINGVLFNGTADISIWANEPMLGEIGSNDAANNALTCGIYRVASWSPLDMYPFGYLRVYNYSGVVHQTFYSHSKYDTGSVAVRQSWDNGASWLGWRSLDNHFVNNTWTGIDNTAPAWNTASGTYKWSHDNYSEIVVAFLGDKNASSSTPSLHLRANYSNGGLWYRTPRDGVGFEREWDKIITEQSLPNYALSKVGYVDGSWTSLNSPNNNSRIAVNNNGGFSVYIPSANRDNFIVDNVGNGSFYSGLSTGDTITVRGVGDQAGAFKKLIQASTTTDGGYLAVGNDGSDLGYVEIGTVDDPGTRIWVRQRNTDNSIIRSALLLDENGNTSFPGTVYTGSTASNQFAINRTDGTGYGISLYNGTSGGNGGLPNYGMAFAKTEIFGKHGYLTGDWATYFTMTGNNDRGWLFKDTSGSAKASITSRGIMSADVGFFVPNPDGSGSTSYSPYGYGIQAGNGDNASWDVHNLVIRSHWGIGFKDYRNQTSVVIDTRIGAISAKGQISTNGNMYAIGDITTEGQFRAASGVIRSNDEHHWIDMGKNGNDTFRLGTYDGVFQFYDTKTGVANVIVNQSNITTGGTISAGYFTTSGNINAGNAVTTNNVVTNTINATGDIRTSTWVYAARFVGYLNGNADTANILYTARNINGVPFNGGNDITVYDNTKVPLNSNPANQGAYMSWNRENGQGRTDFVNNRGNGSGGFDWWNGTLGSYSKLANLDASGRLWAANGFNGYLVGNADTATRLQTARRINGVLFDGSGDISTFPNNVLIPIGDDVLMGDGNVSGCLVIQTTTNTAPGISFRNSNGSVSMSIQNNWFSGVSERAVRWNTTRTINITGACTGSASIDGTSDITINTQPNNNIRAYINFNMTNSTIRRSMGIDSITNIGGGKFKIVLSASAPDGYTVIATASWQGPDAASINVYDASGYTPTSNTFYINGSWGGDNSRGNYNFTYANIAIIY